jgi:hypothetical protein
MSAPRLEDRMNGLKPLGRSALPAVAVSDWVSKGHEPLGYGSGNDAQVPKIT